MDVLLRSIAILIELIVLGALFYHMLNGARIIVFDLGVKPKYSKIITVALVAIGSVIGTFLISHLIAFYPTV